MIHYHGVPFRPDVWENVMRSKHCLVSMPVKGQLILAAKYCQSFILDNGAFSAWKSGKPVTDWAPYYEWVEEWHLHPGFDWAAIPDVIGGTERENRKLIEAWVKRFAASVRGPCGASRAYDFGVPVWHPHESIKYLEQLAFNFRTVAIGGSNKFPLGRKAWWHRLDEAFRALDRGDGRPKCRMHGMRMLDPDVFRKFPLASADSVNVSRNLRMIAHKRGGRHAPTTHRAQRILTRIEAYNSAERYTPQMITHNHLFRNSHVPKLRERPRR